MADARLIAALRAVDVPLDDVRRCLDATSDRASAIAAVLAAHRRRLEARLTRVQRDLHDIGHLATDRLDTLMGSSEATPNASSGIDDERALAAALFNATWELLEKENRSRDEDDAMLHMAHASRHHRGQVARAYIEQARAVAEDITEPDERELLLTDLETIAGRSPRSDAE